MSKRVLIIDDPRVCRKCPCFSVKDERVTCEAAQRQFREGSNAVLFHGERFRPKWCPMVDMPEKLFTWSDDSFEAGWNAALAEMEVQNGL